MLQNIYRTPFSTTYSKQLIDTENNLGISNHYPMRCIGECTTHVIQPTEAYMSHFREAECNAVKCNQVIKDTSILIYKEKLIENVDKSLKGIGLL